jgi:hypothetical protein
MRLRSRPVAASERNVELIRVVVLSPGDVAEERATVAVVVDELNRRVARSHGCLLSLWRWETDARAGLHIAGPQGLIDERMEIGESDIAIGIFWWRFGTPTGDARSGTEHELRRAWEAWRENHRPDVMVYFCEREGFPASKAEAEQLMQVMAFREELPREQLWWSYTTPVEFERLVRGHLEDVIVRRAARTTPPSPVIAWVTTARSATWSASSSAASSRVRPTNSRGTNGRLKPTGAPRPVTGAGGVVRAARRTITSSRCPRTSRSNSTGVV